MGMKDMEITRFKQKPELVEEAIGNFEYSGAIAEYEGGEGWGKDDFEAARVLKTLTKEQVAIIDFLLKDNFNRGVAEGRDRERYKEDDPPTETQAIETPSKECQDFMDFVSKFKMPKLSKVEMQHLANYLTNPKTQER